MNEQQVTALVNKLIKADNSSSRFQLTPIQTHNHDGVNSPVTAQPTVVYVGYVIGDVNAVTPVPSFLFGPKGWLVTYNSVTNDYTITHNLGTELYVVSASIQKVVGETVEAYDVIQGINSFTITWGGGDTNDFTFTLTTISSTLNNFPLYNKKI